MGEQRPLRGPAGLRPALSILLPLSKGAELSLFRAKDATRALSCPGHLSPRFKFFSAAVLVGPAGFPQARAGRRALLESQSGCAVHGSDPSRVVLAGSRWH